MSLTLEQIEAREIVRHREFMADLEQVKQMKKTIEERFINRNELASFLGYSSAHSFGKDTEKRLQEKGYIPKYDKGYLLADARELKKVFFSGGTRTQLNKLPELKKTGS